MAITGEPIIYKCTECGKEIFIPSPESAIDIGVFKVYIENEKPYCYKCWKKIFKRK